MKRMSMKRILTLSTLVAAAAMFSIGCSALLDVDSLQEGGEKKDKGAEAGQKDGGADATPDKEVVKPDAKGDQKIVKPDAKPDQKIVKDMAVDQKIVKDVAIDQKLPDQKVTTPDQKVTTPDQKVTTPDQAVADQKVTTPDQAVVDQQVITPDMAIVDQSVVDQAVGGNCSDGKKNGTETDIDCGGSCTQKCNDGAGCAGGTDCASGVCNGTSKTCDAPNCSDSVKNGDESDVDCGGPACAKCPDAKTCNGDGDCANNWCKSSVCSTNPTHCANTTLDTASGETDVDCGGPCKDKCADAKGCAKNDDCQSTLCDIGATTPTCKAPTCTDSVKNGDETDVDCGGPTCTALTIPNLCASGKGCQSHTDCSTTYCSPNMLCGTEPAHCSDTTKSGDESDVNCGGSCKTKCAKGKACNGPPDCASDSCSSSVCD